MIVDRNNTDRSNTELVFTRASCKLAFSVAPGEPGLATLRYFKNRCEDCPRTSFLKGDCLRRLIKVLKGKSSYESFGFLSRAEKDEDCIGFAYGDGRAHFHGSHPGEKEFDHKCLSDFERRLLIAAVQEVLSCEKITQRYTSGGGRLGGLLG